MSKSKQPVADRTARSGTFVLGRRAFAKVSAVEGIRVSKALESQLRELESTDDSRRRDALVEMYGKT